MPNRKLLNFFFTCLLLLTLAPTALAASVTIHGGEELGMAHLSGSEYVSDVAESGGVLYFMVTDAADGYQKKILSRPVSGDGETTVYTPDMAAGSTELYFTSMEPAASGGLWLQLEDGPGQDAARRVALLQNGQAAAQQTSTSRASLCPEGAVWREGTDFVRWDGTQLTRYPIPAGAEETGDCVLLSGMPCFVDYTGKAVRVYQPDGQTRSIYTLPGGNCRASLHACGGDVYLSHCTGDGVSPFVSDTALVRLPDGKKLSGTYYNIQRLRRQPDGTVQVMAADGSTNIVTYTQVSIAQDALTERLVGEYLTTAEVPMPAIGADGLPSGWRFTDSAGNQWLYAGAAADGGIAVTKLTADGTTVGYTAAPLSGFPLYLRGAGVSFDTEPYITDTGFTMVPVRGVACLLDAEIAWDGDTQTVTVRQGEHTVLLTIGSMTALADGVEVPLGTPAVITGGRTMLPLRFLTETLGGEIRWENGAVSID
ncbi:MAG: copper amine oxidase N-terminal domain-containing protein, partial [Oscillospiraceae bacterium]|nr:copper amine oxidase N-terminal domain-containing protein [Oscillospiraceae bacterium]